MIYSDKGVDQLIEKLDFGGGPGGGGGGPGIGPGSAGGNPGLAGASGGQASGGQSGSAGGTGPGHGGEQGSDAAIAADPDTGNFSGAATGFGQDGYGDPSEGQPGIFGGGVLGGVPGTPAPAPSPSDATTSGLPPGADPVASGDPTSAGFGGTVIGGSIGEGGQSMGTSHGLGSQIGEAIEQGNMSLAEGQAALGMIGQQNSGLSGILGQAAANFGAQRGGTPDALSNALSVIPGFSIATAIGQGVNALGSAITGQSAIGPGTPGATAGPGGVAGPEDKKVASTMMALTGNKAKPQEPAASKEADAVEQPGLLSNPRITAYNRRKKYGTV